MGTFTTKEEPELPEGTVASDEEPPSLEEPEDPPEESSYPVNTTTPDQTKYLLGALLTAIILLSIIAFRLARGRRRLYR